MKKCDHNKEIDNGGRCCCNCKYHIEDFTHCCTTTKKEGETGCICGAHKGWICMPPETDQAYSGWKEHSLCEMHEFKD